MLLAVSGGLYQAVASYLDARRFPEPGHSILVDGRTMQLYCTGEGSPTVVLEAGLGDLLSEWSRVQSELAKTARVCSYDRAGYGGSDAGPMPRTSAQIAAELHALLAAAGEHGPYVLVGHSFGGYNVRVFRGVYPNDVSGMVLVDSVQEDQYKLLPAQWQVVAAALQQRYQAQARWAPLYIYLGVARLQLRMHGLEASHLILQSKYLRARASELESIQKSAEQARAAGSLGALPLVVLTAGLNADAGMRQAMSAQELAAYQRTWADDLQLRLARLSSRARREMVPDSGHDIPSERPDAVVVAVREVIALGHSRSYSSGQVR